MFGAWHGQRELFFLIKSVPTRGHVVQEGALQNDPLNSESTSIYLTLIHVDAIQCRRLTKWLDLTLSGSKLGWRSIQAPTRLKNWSFLLQTGAVTYACVLHTRLWNCEEALLPWPSFCDWFPTPCFREQYFGDMISTTMVRNVCEVAPLEELSLHPRNVLKVALNCESSLLSYISVTTMHMSAPNFIYFSTWNICDCWN